MNVPGLVIVAMVALVLVAVYAQLESWWQRRKTRG